MPVDTRTTRLDLGTERYLRQNQDAVPLVICKLLNEIDALRAEYAAALAQIVDQRPASRRN